MTLADLLPVLPEIVLLVFACLVLIIDLYLKEEQKDVNYLLTQAGLLLSLILTTNVAANNPSAFNGMFILDPLAVVIKSFIYAISFMVFVYSRKYLKERNLYRGEYFVLGLFGILGMLIMASAGSMLMLYLGLELLSLSLYALVAFQRDSKQGSEAAMKYFILGALASGLLLYGMSMLYGVTQSLDLAVIAEKLSHLDSSAENLVLMLGLVFVVVGLGFKLGVVPFHMWIPDVYHGAPTSVTLYISAAPKLAAFILVIRLLDNALISLLQDWQLMLQVLAVLSLILGNIIAIAQSNIKRMLAYSAISHMGFIILGISMANNDAYAVTLFYSITYALISAGAFGVILLLTKPGFEADNLTDLKGLSQRHPWFAFVMLLLMFSLAGVPPTVGFYAKLAVLQVVVAEGFIWLALIAVVASVIGAFYYLRAVKLMYFDNPENEEPIQATTDMQVLLSANGIAVLLIGLFPASLMTLCMQALG